MLQELTANSTTILLLSWGGGGGGRGGPPGGWGGGGGGGEGMTNLWSSLLYNPYQAAQHKHIFLSL